MRAGDVVGEGRPQGEARGPWTNTLVVTSTIASRHVACVRPKPTRRERQGLPRRQIRCRTDCASVRPCYRVSRAGGRVVRHGAG